LNGGEILKQISLRLDNDLHKEVKYLLVEIEKSFNEYVLGLIRKDLEGRKKETTASTVES
jgi:predicted HicB family RNase H-like nuclease